MAVEGFAQDSDTCPVCGNSIVVRVDMPFDIGLDALVGRVELARATVTAYLTKHAMIHYMENNGEAPSA